MEAPLKIIECPRDAMQGIHDFIPTKDKINYINSLLECGFDTIDFGSFVSPKSIPQMRDTAEVLKGLNEKKTTKLLAIVANSRGAQEAVNFEEIDFLGYPFSISEEFQKRNTNATIEESLHRVDEIQNLVQKRNKKLVVYLSMGFGNPYGELWHPDLVSKWSDRLSMDLGVEILALSDTIGCANPEIVSELFAQIIPEFSQIEFGAHLHTLPKNAKLIMDAAYLSGCRRFDGALKGFGGCPMAMDDLTGNMPTELIVEYLNENQIRNQIQLERLKEALSVTDTIFTF